MKNSKELVKRAGIVPKLRLGEQIIGEDGKKLGVKATGPHKVKLIEDRIVRGIDFKGKETEFVEYILEENGEKKTYKTKLKNDNGELSYLVQRLSDVPEGGEVVLEMKKKGIKNYVSVSEISGADEIEVDDTEHDVGEEDVPL